MTRISTPCCTSAAGRAPTTSASPPVLTSGNASDATARILVIWRSPLLLCDEAVDHGLGDQADAAVGAAEALAVELGVLADDQAFGDLDAAVDDYPLELGAARDIDIGQ